MIDGLPWRVQCFLAANPEYKVEVETGGYAVIKETNEHGGLGCIRHAKMLDDVPKVLEELKRANGDA